MQPQQRDRGAGISGGRGRILKWLAPRRKSAELQLFFQRRFGVEEAAGFVGIGEAAHHLIGDAPREIEIAHRAGDFIRVEASQRGEGIISSMPRTKRLLGT